MENSAPQDNHSYCRLFKELKLSLTGYGPSLFGNRLVRTHMPGGVEAGGERSSPLPDWALSTNPLARVNRFNYLIVKPSAELLYFNCCRRKLLFSYVNVWRK